MLEPQAAASATPRICWSRAVVSFGQNPDINALQEMLGLGHSQEAQSLVAHFLLGNTSGALGVIGKASSNGVDLRQIHRQSVELLRAVLLIKSGASETLDLDTETLNEMGVLARKVQLPKVMRCLKAMGEINMRLDATSSLPLELAVVEASLAEETQPSRPTVPARATPTPVRAGNRPSNYDRSPSTPPAPPPTSTSTLRRQPTRTAPCNHARARPRTQSFPSACSPG